MSKNTLKNSLPAAPPGGVSSLMYFQQHAGSKTFFFFGHGGAFFENFTKGLLKELALFFPDFYVETNLGPLRQTSPSPGANIPSFSVPYPVSIRNRTIADFSEVFRLAQGQ